MSQLRILSIAMALVVAGATFGLKASAPDPQPLPIVLEFKPEASPELVDSMAKLLNTVKDMPASRYKALPLETTLTESRLFEIVNTLNHVRPSDGGDGPTGAKRMKALIIEAMDLYQGYLALRIQMIENASNAS